MAREGHKPEGTTAATGTSRLWAARAWRWGKGLPSSPPPRLGLHPLWGIITKRKTLINCSYSSGGPPRWSRAGAHAVVPRLRELSLFILEISFQGMGGSALEQAACGGSAVSVLPGFPDWLVKVLSNLSERHTWPCFQQKFGLQTPWILRWMILWLFITENHNNEMFHTSTPRQSYKKKKFIFLGVKQKMRERVAVKNDQRKKLCVCTDWFAALLVLGLLASVPTCYDRQTWQVELQHHNSRSPISPCPECSKSRYVNFM